MWITLWKSNDFPWEFLWIFSKTFENFLLDIPFWMVENQLRPFFGKVHFSTIRHFRFIPFFEKYPHLPRWKSGGKSTYSPFQVKKRQKPIREDNFSKIPKQYNKRTPKEGKCKKRRPLRDKIHFSTVSTPLTTATD